jgi:predicted nucleic acid-binding protein
MGTPRILIDTGAIFAFVTRTGSHHEAAKRFVREWLDQEGIFTLLDVDTWAVFQRFTDKEWSYTDCAMLASARREKISAVFAFDRHFLQMPGIERHPYSAANAEGGKDGPLPMARPQV